MVPPWLQEHYARVDANDFIYVLGRFSNEIVVRFGNRPAATGREAVRELLADVHRHFESSRHLFANVWHQGTTTLIQFDVTYTLHDGSQVPMGTFTILDREDGLITSMRVYIDETPLRGLPSPVAGGGAPKGRRGAERR
jgi:ketosteroid isomerase-like protein